MPHPIPVRRLEFDFSDVPRAWCDDDQQMTHVINGLSAVFPEGERFFVRSVRHYEDQMDEASRERIRGFYGQEANHGAAHRATFEMLEQQGYEIASWLAWYKSDAYAAGTEQRVPPIVRLASTVALEHFTATLAEVVFEPGEIHERMHPAMADLLRWHAAEEIEHKAVAFDVLQQVDPRLRWRAIGLALAFHGLLHYAGSAGRHLGRQDGTRGVRRRLIWELVKRPRVLIRGLAFLKRDFHPDQWDNYDMARDYLASIGRLAA